jgi:hypothetical protein
VTRPRTAARRALAPAVLLTVTALLLWPAACAQSSTTGGTRSGTSHKHGQSPSPCTGAAATAISHVVVVVMENKGYSSIIGSSAAPYLNTLAAQCGLATNYHAVAHPSLPNYLAMTGGSTFGITDDLPPAQHPISAASVFSQLGSRWQAYQESMPSSCYPSNTSLYAVRHNPATYYTGLAATCPTLDVPLPANPSFGAAFTFVTPNLQDDMHDGTIQQGDAWLSSFVPKVLASSQYQSGSLALFIVWDENDGPVHAAGNQVPCLVVSPSVRPRTSVSTWFDHYSLLATWEDLLGVFRLGNTVTAPSMVAAFRL